MPSGFCYFKSSYRSSSNRRGVWLVSNMTTCYRKSCIKCKQYRPWLDASFCGVWSGSTFVFYRTLSINGWNMWRFPLSKTGSIWADWEHTDDKHFVRWGWGDMITFHGTFTSLGSLNYNSSLEEWLLSHKRMLHLIRANIICMMSLRKHAYSNILKILPPKMKIFR